MDRNIKRNYHKLKIKRKTKLYGSNNNNNLKQYFNNKFDGNKTSNVDVGKFKIERFLNDVNKYGLPSAYQEVDHIGKECGNETYGNHKRDKDCNKNESLFKEKISFKDKSGNGVGKIKPNRKTGLFQRGFMTKNINNKGLMPQSLNARLNEDLKKLIELANGKKYDSPKVANTNLRNDDAIWNKITSFNDHNLSDDGASDIDCNSKKDSDVTIEMDDGEGEVRVTKRKRITDSPEKVEAEVQVSNDLTEVPRFRSNRSQDDLYIKFTHFVTRSLFSCGINRDDVRNYTESLKESLVSMYYKNLKKKDLHKNDTHVERDSDKTSFQEESYVSKTPCSSPNLPISSFCPTTSRSEEGPSREKYNFPNNSQLSDDLLIRKPPKMYSSGIEFLRSLSKYSDQSNQFHNNETESSSMFSPIENNYRSTKNDESFYVSNENEIFSPIISEVNVNNNEMNRNNCGSKYSYNETHTRDDLNDTISCRGNGRLYMRQYSTEDDYNFNDSNNDGNRCQCCVNGNLKNVLLNSDIKKYNSIKESSPPYISILPSNHTIIRNNSNIEYCYGNNIDQVPSSQDYQQTELTMLSIPKVLPLMKSPEIVFNPRKMF